jgi:Phospholipid methyltransferase
MKRAQSIIGSAIFLVLAPGIVAVAVPSWLSGWRMNEPLLGFVGFRVMGGVLIACGLPILFDSFARFALKGLGTPAPVAPTKHLVITGFYRYVRNPMYIAVSWIIFGQGLLLGNRDLLLAIFQENMIISTCLPRRIVRALPRLEPRNPPRHIGAKLLVFRTESPSQRRLFIEPNESGKSQTHGCTIGRRDAGATENKLRRVVSRKAVGKSEMSADEEFAGSNPLAALELHGFHTQGCPAAADHD